MIAFQDLSLCGSTIFISFNITVAGLGLSYDSIRPVAACLTERVTRLRPVFQRKLPNMHRGIYIDQQGNIFVYILVENVSCSLLAKSP